MHNQRRPHQPFPALTAVSRPHHTPRMQKRRAGTHERRVRVPSVDGMLPESWLLFKLNRLQDTRTDNASHHGTQRRRHPPPLPALAYKHTQPQLRAPILCRVNNTRQHECKLAHHDSAALYTSPQPQSEAFSTATPHTQHLQHSRRRCRLIRHSSGTHQPQQARSEYLYRTSAHDDLPATAATADSKRATQHRSPTVQRSGNAHVHAAQRGAHTRAINLKTIPRSAAQSHGSHSETRCRNAHATTASDTAAQHPTHCARHSAGNAHPTRPFYIARMTQPRFFTFSQAQRAPCRTCRLAPRSPLPSHRKHARAGTHTTRQAPPTRTTR
jgi:hypothetical protein